MQLYSHDWNKFIEPEEFSWLLLNTGFKEIAINRFEVKSQDKTSGEMIVDINENTNVMYIGKAVLGVK